MEPVYNGNCLRQPPLDYYCLSQLH